MIGAIDIGGTKIAVGMVDEDGHVLASTSYPTDPESGLEHAIQRMATMLKETSVKAGGTFSGIGIGCTGPVYPELGTIGNVEFMPGWEGANLVQLLSTRMGVSVAIENDADAAALGEWAWGAGKGTQSFILVTVGTGIGAGLVLDGRLYRGVGSAHPEIGHHVIDPTGPLCFCGAHGCWESLASGPAMERWAQEQHPRTQPLSARELCSLAEQGEPEAMAAVGRTARYLAIGLANVVTLYIPECIALGGGLMLSYHLFKDAFASTIQSNCGLVPHEKVHLVPAALGAQSGLVGAARVWLNRFTSV
ncbi:MAG: glucokinase [Chloroflexi bacterium RBG_13_50_21]|nr:MAG: glucokinase [Chloroflexi bacterium RBG_13_50_21]OGO62020.1 MAG: glucokinase [Chloroflexi bacterium RBG_19FT_COMBO_50_10]